MKHKLVTAAVVVFVLAGITMFNKYFEPKPATAAQEQESQEVKEKLEQNKAAAASKVLGPDEMKEPAPDVFKVKLETTKGDVLVEVHKEWAPLGAQRFYDLVKAGFYNDTRLFRVVTGFVVQWGINGDPAVNEKWDVKLKDEPVKQSNLKGYLSFAAGGPNTRTTQMFINLGDNTQLDTYTPGFAPFGKVVEGMEVVEHFNSKYDEQPTQTQSQMRTMGNAFTDKRFPGLDSIKSASIVP